MSVNKNRIQNITVCPSEIAAGKLGTAKGALTLAEALQKKLCPQIPLNYVPVNNVVREEDNKMPAKYMEQVAHNLASTYHSLKNSGSPHTFQFNVTADHSNAIATISAFSDTHAPDQIGVIWVDAHADLHSPYTTPSGNMHGMPLAALLGVDNVDCAKRTISPLEADWWDRFKDIGLAGSFPKLLPRNLVIIGVRDTESQEDKLMEKLGIRFVRPDYINQVGMQQVIVESMAYLQSCKAVYCSFDIDSIDADKVPGTGTPVANGLSLDQAKEAVRLLFNHPKIACFGLTEYNAEIDLNKVTFENVMSLFD